MVDIGYHLKNHGVTLIVSVWQHNQDIIPTYELEEVWVHITRVPHAFRNYPVFWALGTVIGTTREVDMYTYRKMGVIRVKVGILNKSELPLTTDLVFGTEGYHITYTLEDDSFEPAVAPNEDVDPMDQDDFGAGNGGTEESGRETAAKKMRSDSKTDNSAPQSGSAGPTPMQHHIAVTPLGKRRPCPPPKLLVFMKSDDKLPPIAVTIPKTCFRPDPGCTPYPGSPVREAEWSVANTPDHQQPQVSASTFTPNSEVAARRGCQSHTASSPFPTPSPENLHGHGRRETFNPVRQKLMSAPPPQTESGQSGAEPLTGLRTPSKSTEADEYVMDKAKRRAAIRNLDSPIAASLRGSNIASSPGYLLDYSLAPYVGYSSSAYLTEYACSGVLFLGSGGQDFFLPRHMGGGLVIGLAIINVSA
ncbi:hypothetical protein PVAP13_5KG223300 [Panicum virgatum]|uniref:DUF4283 domain-containing protein n=1 Tax=Panicum virgatum TaxID=38727 RepID=A0A8T0SK84_PANVG|nr:hypothetical protein PVAP13_5KG223300 [Panicum virgatum]